MPIGTPVAIGTATGGPLVALGVNTTAAVPAGALVIVCAGWGFGDPKTISSVSGGGLTYSIDHDQAFAGVIDWGFGVVSAQAPAGLASATTITVTLTGGPTNAFGILLSVSYCEGLETSSVKDVSDGNGAAAAAWDTTATSTTVADTLVIGGSVVDGLKTNTPSGSANELHDFQFGGESWSACAEYKILSATGSASLTGTWSGGGSPDATSAFVAYKGLPSGPDTGLAWIRG